MKLSILCLNCFGIPISFNKRLRFKLIAKEINKIQPDLIMLQEVIEHNDKNLLSTELEKFGWHFYSNRNGLLESGGLVMISKKLQLKNLEFHKFTNQGPDKLIVVPDKMLGKGFQSANCDIDGTNFLIINVHTLCPYARTSEDLKFQSMQFKQLIKFINDQKNINIIIAGDLNTDPNSTDIKYLKDAFNLIDSLSDDTYTVDPSNLNRGWLMNLFGNGKSYRTDYILTSKNVSIEKSEVVFKEPVISNNKNIHLSDHFGVFAQLETATSLLYKSKV